MSPMMQRRRLPTARERLFELIRQQEVADRQATLAPGPHAPRARHADDFLTRAERSFGLHRARDAAQPRKPVATTNFSELSARDAGGLTLATLAKRCLSSFWSSPSAPPASTFDTNVPPSSSTSSP